MNCKLSEPRGWLQCASSNNKVKEILARYFVRDVSFIFPFVITWICLQAAQKQEDERKQQEDMKNSILTQVLNQSARARCRDIPHFITCFLSVGKYLTSFVFYQWTLLDLLNQKRQPWWKTCLLIWQDEDRLEASWGKLNLKVCWNK